MKVAYWPGCVSRGFTPELHGFDGEDRAAARPRARRRWTARRAAAPASSPSTTPSSPSTLNAPALRPGSAGRGHGAHDEHLLDLPGRTVRSARSGSTQAPSTARRSTRRWRAEGLVYEKGLTNKNFLWLLVEEIGLEELRARRVLRPVDRSARRPVLRLLTSCARPDRLGIDDAHPRDSYLGSVVEALGGTVTDYAGSHKCCGFPIITMNKQASLKQAGGIWATRSTRARTAS